MKGGTGEPCVSVVVSTYQRAATLPVLLQALEAQDLEKPFEIVIVDDGSADETWSVLEQAAARSRLDFRPMRLAENRGRSGGRNAGWRAARAPLVVFTDDDCRPAPSWLRAMEAALRHAEIVQGKTLPDPEQVDRWGPFSHTIEVTEERGYYETCNIGYHRALLERLGGFDPSYELTHEDLDLAWRAREQGARTAFAEDALVFHEIRPSSYRDHLRRKFRWHDVPLAVRRHPQLRRELYFGWWWKRSHPKALLALAGLVVAGVPGGRPAARLARFAVGVSLVRPYYDHRTRIAPLRCGPRRRVALIPLVWFSDLLEVWVMTRGSVRHRTLIL